MSDVLDMTNADTEYYLKVYTKQWKAEARAAKGK